MILLDEEDDCEDLEFSLRFINFIKSGVVLDLFVYD